MISLVSATPNSGATFAECIPSLGCQFKESVVNNQYCAPSSKYYIYYKYLLILITESQQVFHYLFLMGVQKYQHFHLNTLVPLITTKEGKGNFFVTKVFHLI